MKGISKKVRVNADGTETVYWYSRVRGKSRYCGKGAEGQRDAREARSSYVAEKLKARRQGINLDTQMTEFSRFKDMMNWFMELPSVQAKTSSYSRYTTCAAHLARHFGRKPVTQIEAVHLESYREKRLTEGAAHSSVDLETSLMRMIYRKAKANKLVLADAGPGEFALNNTSQPRRLITDQEYNKILKAAETVPDFRDVIVCGYETSMRAAEVTQLRVMDVRLGEVISEIPERVVADYLDVEDVKSRKTPKYRKQVPISDTLEAMLRRRIKGLRATDLVFTNGDAPWNTNSGQISKFFERVCNRAEVPYSIHKEYEDSQGKPITGIDFHCLRVTRITKWAEHFNDNVVMLASGHQNPQIYRDKYLKLSAATAMVLVGKSTRGENKNVVKVSHKENLVG